MRVLIVDAEPDPGRESLARIVVELGHDLVGVAADDGASEQADLAVVRLDLSASDALRSLDQILDESVHPVVAVVSAGQPSRSDEVSTRGVFACLPDGSREQLSDALEVTLGRFVAYHRLHGACGGRAGVEQATGILMAHHRIEAGEAAAMLTDHAGRLNRDVVESAAALIDSHRLLVRGTTAVDRASGRTRLRLAVR